MTKLLNAAGRGGRGPAETTAKFTDLSDSDIVFDIRDVSHLARVPSGPQ